MTWVDAPTHGPRPALRRLTDIDRDPDPRGWDWRSITGDGLELVLTLGTGLGSLAFRNGRLALHLERTGMQSITATSPPSELKIVSSTSAADAMSDSRA